MNLHPTPRRIVFVDDTRAVLDAFREPLRHMFGQQVYLVQHAAQSQEELIEEIMAQKPDIVLLDGNMADGIRGYHLVPHLLRRHPRLLCIGFSSADWLQDVFLQAGARGFVHKDASDPPGTLEKVMRIVEESTKDEAA